MDAPGASTEVAVVTGAASGIGAAVADALRSRGARVASCDLTASYGPDSFALDVADSAAVEEVFSQVETQLGPITTLVNAAGVLLPAKLTDTSDADWEAAFAVNSTGVFNTIRCAARHMIPRRRGAVVTVSSNAGGVPRQGTGGYAASKAAATHLTRCFGLELAEFGIRCNVVCPGSTDTPMLRTLLGDDAESVAVAGSPESFRLGIPLRRIASPSDVAEAVSFLSSEAARHLTMQELQVDGGATLR